jgi:hypothetical protein
LNADLGEPAAEVERFGAAEGKFPNAASCLGFEALEIPQVCELAELVDEVPKLGELCVSQKRNAATERDTVEGQFRFIGFAHEARPSANRP